VTEEPPAIPLKSVYTPQAGIPSPVITSISLKVPSCLTVVESDIVAPNMLASYTNSKFSDIVMSLQQILNCQMKLAE
jgi:hypothetical protein